jgi:hypothetical protein
MCALSEVTRVVVSERCVSDSVVLRIWTLLSDDSRAARDRVYEVEEEILRRFPHDLFEFHCHLDRDYVPAGDTIVFQRER